MGITRIYYISIYTILNVSALMLCFSEGAVFPQGLTLAFSVLAYELTDRRKVFSLSPLWTNVLGVGGFLLAVGEVVYGEVAEVIDRRILAGAHLLVYLSWVVMFQRKQVTQYWWLTALSVLQVAVGSVLTRAGWYGTCLFLYFFLVIWTLSVFSLYQAHRAFSRYKAPGGLGALAMAATGVAVEGPAGDGPGGGIPVGDISAGTKRLYNQPSRTMATLQMGRDEQWITARFSGGTVLTALGSIFIGAIFFVLIPRVWIGRPPFSDDMEIEGGGVLTGFSAEVRLGDFGQILESTKQVFEVRVFDGDRELGVEEYAQALGYDEPMFRGASLAEYRGGGRWYLGNPGGRDAPFSLEGERDPVRQEIHMEPIGVEYLFAMHPVSDLRLDDRGRRALMHSTTSAIVFANRYRPKKPFDYTVYSPRNVSDDVKVRRDPKYSIRMGIEGAYVRVPPQGLERLQQLARNVVSGIPPDSALVRARAIERQLRDSGDYGYTLNASIDDPTIDPIEDFLFNRKAGHCEYFASAMTLMLRSVGIPARLVSGFKGGEKNSVTGGFSVQQRHAHAWVEAYIDDHWVVFDPTPGSRQQSVEQYTPRLKTWADLQTFVSALWNRQVLDMSLQNQYRLIYDPMISTGKEWLEKAKKPGGLKAILSEAISFLLSPSEWFSWVGAVITFALLCLALLTFWLSRRLIRFVRRLRQQLGRQLNARQMRVAFYEDFREVCEEFGVRRSPWISYREYAADVRQTLGATLEPAGLSSVPETVIENFLAIRFGERDLPQPLRQELESSIEQMRECLQRQRERQAELSNSAVDDRDEAAVKVSARL